MTKAERMLRDAERELADAEGHLAELVALPLRRMEILDEYRKARRHLAIAEQDPRLTKPWAAYATHPPYVTRCRILGERVQALWRDLQDNAKAMLTRGQELAKARRAVQFAKDNVEGWQAAVSAEQAKPKVERKKAEPKPKAVMIKRGVFVPRRPYENYLRLVNHLHTKTFVQDGHVIIHHGHGYLKLRSFPSAMALAATL